MFLQTTSFHHALILARHLIRSNQSRYTYIELARLGTALAESFLEVSLLSLTTHQELQLMHLVCTSISRHHTQESSSFC